MTQINLNQKRKYLILSGLVKKTDYIAKSSDIESKIPSINSKSALTAVENKMPDVSSLVKKTRLFKN